MATNIGPDTATATITATNPAADDSDIGSSPLAEKAVTRSETKTAHDVSQSASEPSITVPQREPHTPSSKKCKFDQKDTLNHVHDKKRGDSPTATSSREPHTPSPKKRKNVPNKTLTHVHIKKPTNDSIVTSPGESHTLPPKKRKVDQKDTLLREHYKKPDNDSVSNSPNKPDSHTDNVSRAEHALHQARSPTKPPPRPRLILRAGTRPANKSTTKATMLTRPNPTSDLPSLAPLPSAQRPEARILHPLIRGAQAFTATISRFYFHSAERGANPKSSMKMVRYEVFPRPKPTPPTQPWESKGVLIDGSADPGFKTAFGPAVMEQRKGLPARVVEMLREVESDEEVKRIVESAKGGRRYVRKEWEEMDPKKAVEEVAGRKWRRLRAEREETVGHVEMEDTIGGDDGECMDGLEIEGEGCRDSVMGEVMRRSLVVKLKVRVEPGSFAE